jgi:phosphohistidine phosphatase
MQVLLIRHAIAEDREVFREQTHLDDSERPLTSKGRTKMKKAARGLRNCAGQVHVLATSPLVRAVATARIVSKRCAYPFPTEVEALSPDRDPREFLAWLARSRPAPVEPSGGHEDPGEGRADSMIIAAVGHEPHLSRFIGWSVTGRDDPLGTLKKGGACMLRFDQEVAAGAAAIEWLLQAGQLRRLG